MHASYGNIANISDCYCGAIKHDTREYSTPYVTKRGFLTLENAAVFMFVLWYKTHKVAEVKGGGLLMNIYNMEAYTNKLDKRQIKIFLVHTLLNFTI